MVLRKRKPKSGAAAPARKSELAVFFTARAVEDRAWLKAKQSAAYERLERLLEDIRRTPHAGLGKPEPLRFKWSGWWSRRITREHRLVYKVEAGTLYIAQCRFHYEK